MSRLAEGFVRLWKRSLGPVLSSLSGGACRFQPTCSEYAAIAISEKGWIRGLLLALWRILRCHPFSRGGFDPVPGTWPPPNHETQQHQG